MTTPRSFDIAPFVDPEIIPPEEWMVSSVLALVRTVTPEGRERIHMLHAEHVDTPKVLGELEYMKQRALFQLQTAMRIEHAMDILDDGDEDDV